MPLLERCPHFRQCYVKGMVPIREASSFQVYNIGFTARVHVHMMPLLFSLLPQEASTRRCVELAKEVWELKFKLDSDRNS